MLTLVVLHTPYHDVSHLLTTNSHDNNCPAMVDILVSSRKLKNEETSPTEVLFKTHSYEIKMIPNEYFFEWNGGRKSGYTVELKLFKKVVSSRKKREDGETQEQFTEHTDCGVPLISYSFTEDVFTNTWTINLIWPDEKTKVSFRGDFYFSLAVFRKVDDDTTRRIFTRISSRFRIVSKPGVYLNKKRKKGEDATDDEEVESNLFKKLPPPSKFIPSNPTANIHVNLMPIIPENSNSSSSTSANVQQYFQQVVYDSPPIPPFFPSTLPFSAKPTVQQHQYIITDQIEQPTNAMPFPPSQPKFSLEKTQELFSFTQNSQFLSSQPSSLMPSLSYLLPNNTPLKTETDENPFSPITPRSPATPTGIFAHQPIPQKGVLSLNFSQLEATPQDFNPWSFFNSQEDQVMDVKKDDLYYKML